MKSIFLVFLGGGIGSVMRYLLGKWINSLIVFSFPVGTLAVNIFACFVLGLVVGLADQRQLISPAARLFLATGICGGFSTFSTFSHETIVLFQNGLTLSMIFYVGLSLILCVAATFGGMYLIGRI